MSALPHCMRVAVRRAHLIGGLTSLALALTALAGAPAAGLAQVHSPVGGSGCAKPTGLSAGAPQGTPEEEADSFILGKLKDGAFDYAKSEGLGYALKLLGHQQKTVDPAEIDRQFASVNSRLGSLADQQFQDCSAILDAINALAKNDNKQHYQDRLADLDDPLANLDSANDLYRLSSKDLQSNGGRVSQLSDTERQDMGKLLSMDGLDLIVNEINRAEANAEDDKVPLVTSYAGLLTDELGYDPYTSHIFPAEFLNPGHAQIDYYAGELTQAAYLYASIAHLSFSYTGYTHDGSLHDVGTAINAFVDKVQSDIHNWSVEFADGPDSQWVSQGNGYYFDTIPHGTLIDDTHQSHPTLWTEDGAALDETPLAPDLTFCATTAAFCFADRYIAKGTKTEVADTSLVTPSPSSMYGMVSAYADDGVGGWHIPTADDWKALEAGATTGTESLWDWAKERGIAPLEAKPAASHPGGQDVTRTAITPVWENAGTATTPDFRVLTATQTSDQTEQPQALSEVTVGVAGADIGAAARAVLTREWQFAGGSSSVALGGKHKARTHHHRHRHGVVPVRHRHRHASAPVLRDPAPQTFGDAHACGTVPQQTYVVPDGAGSVRIEAKGGAGGGKNGGRGGTATVVVPARAGETLYVQVGGAAHGVSGGTGGGGNGGNDSASEQGAGGGGASGVATGATCDHWLLIAGGGGGTGGMAGGGQGGDGGSVTQSGLAGASAGSGGASAGSAGSRSPSNVGGIGGQYQSLKGKANAHSGTDGDLLQGGAGGQGDVNTGHTYNGNGGGGGAGYWGGGGGGGQGAGQPGGGGAGGESYVVAGATDHSFGQNDGGAGGSVTITPIAKVQPPHTLTVSDTNLSYGQTLTLTAHVPVDETGGVGFYDSQGNVAQGLGTATLHHGTATVTLNTDDARLHRGVNSITFSTGGDAQYLANDSSPVNVTISPKAPPVTLSVSGTAPPAGYQPTSMVASVPAAVNGTITFHDDLLGDLGTATIANGYATLAAIPAMLNGAHHVTARYKGTDPYLASTSAPVTVTISGVSEYSFSTTDIVGTHLLEVPGAVATPGVAVDVWHPVPSPSDPVRNEVWATYDPGTATSDPHISRTQLFNGASGLCLTANRTAAHITQEPCASGAADQQWLLSPTDSGTLIQSLQSAGGPWPAGTDNLATAPQYGGSAIDGTSVTLTTAVGKTTLWTVTSLAAGTRG